MKRCKALGLDGITCEHLFSHALLPSRPILAKLFNFMIVTGNIPSSFNQSYAVPIPKSSCNLYGKTVTVDDFRGVSLRMPFTCCGRPLITTCRLVPQ